MAHLRNLAEDGAIPARVIDELMGTWPPTGLVGCVGSVIETGYWHMTQEMQICVAARAQLIGTYLQGADLRDAHLEEAWLSGAHLRGAWLGDAHWKGTDLSRAELKRRERQATTIWPEGWRGELPE